MLAQIELWTKGADDENRFYVLPKHLDERVARLHLAKIDMKLTELAPDQACRRSTRGAVQAGAISRLMQRRIIPPEHGIFSSKPLLEGHAGEASERIPETVFDFLGDDPRARVARRAFALSGRRGSVLSAQDPVDRPATSGASDVARNGATARLAIDAGSLLT